MDVVGRRIVASTDDVHGTWRIGDWRRTCWNYSIISFITNNYVWSKENSRSEVCFMSWIAHVVYRTRFDYSTARRNASPRGTRPSYRVWQLIWELSKPKGRPVLVFVMSVIYCSQYQQYKFHSQHHYCNNFHQPLTLANIPKWHTCRVPGGSQRGCDE